MQALIENYYGHNKYLEVGVTSVFEIDFYFLPPKYWSDLKHRISLSSNEPNTISIYDIFKLGYVNV